MILLEKFFKNHFASKEISDNRLQAFSEDHIFKTTSRLSTHPNPVIQALLDALLPLHNAYFGAITDENIKFAIQQSRTIVADNAWNAVLAFIRQHEGTVRGAWGINSGTYQEFYPLGLNEYNHATKLNKAQLLVRYLTAATTHAADLPATFVADFTALKNDWGTKYTTQQQQIGLVKDADWETTGNRKPVEVQLMKNLLGIAGEFVGQPEVTVVFFNRQLLESPGSNFNVTVSGILTSNATGLPIAGAQFQMGPYSFTSGADGSFSKSFFIDELTTYNVTITAAGFQTQNTTYQFTPGVDIEQDTQLTPSVAVGSISGALKDAGTLAGIAGGTVNLTAPGVSIIITADGSGNYNKSGIPVGTYTATANAPGHIGQSVSVTISANFNTVHDFNLVVVP